MAATGQELVLAPVEVRVGLKIAVSFFLTFATTGQREDEGCHEECRFHSGVKQISSLRLTRHSYCLSPENRFVARR